MLNKINGKILDNRRKNWNLNWNQNFDFPIHYLMLDCWEIISNFYFHIILYVLTLDNAEKLHGINCKVDELFSSAYVTPVVDQPTEVTGCNSRDTASGELVSCICS